MIRIKLSTLLWIINTISIMMVFCSLFDFSPIGLIVSFIFAVIFGVITYFIYGRNTKIISRNFAISAVIALLMALIASGGIGSNIAWWIIAFALPFGISLPSKRYLIGGICGGICLSAVLLDVLLFGLDGIFFSSFFFVVTIVIEIIIMIVKAVKSKKRKAKNEKMQRENKDYDKRWDNSDRNIGINGDYR